MEGISIRERGKSMERSSEGCSWDLEKKERKLYILAIAVPIRRRPRPEDWIRVDGKVADKFVTPRPARGDGRKHDYHHTQASDRQWCETTDPPVHHYLLCRCRRSTLVQFWPRSRLWLPSLCYGGNGPRGVHRTLLGRKDTQSSGTCLIFRRVSSGRGSRRWRRSMVSNEYFRGVCSCVRGCLTWAGYRDRRLTPGYDGFACSGVEQ